MAAEIMDRGDSTFVVTFDDECVLAMVTSSGDERQRGERNPVALLQLCVGRRCLLFKSTRATNIPAALFEFLADDRFTFVGVGVSIDAENLLEDYDLLVRRPVELSPMAAEETGRPELRRPGLAALARAVMRIELIKPKRVTLSRWDCEWLSLEQVKYACNEPSSPFEVVAGDRRRVLPFYGRPSRAERWSPTIFRSSNILLRFDLGSDFMPSFPGHNEIFLAENLPKSSFGNYISKRGIVLQDSSPEIP
ncbi:unnamed protein product [Spirodela intermedia]|uniref:3'-5' exonuclease domain-containing protein n=1 Tax=Spirodela intermedia TaxID=51605 RepID=A0A7I8J039_SPIIN|nr:unnamed protein product [Spirodela intermedia]CAA6663594.1 unnamed protein product [Spirodela intermedia]